MNRSQKYTFVTAMLFLLFIVGLLLYKGFATKKLAYVDTITLFENCKMKKELYSQLEQKKKVYDLRLDSIYSVFKGQEIEIRKETASMQNGNVEATYLIERKKVEEEMLENINRSNEQIWTFINQNVSEYSKLNKIDYLFGANGQGNIMYANEEENITKEVLKFIDDKYEGDK